MKKLLVVSFLLAVAGIANARTVSTYTVDDGLTNAWRNPEVAVDSDGNIHIVAQGQPNDLSASDDIYYFRISKGGTVLNEALGVSTAGAVHDNGRAHVRALPDGRAIVAWREHSPRQVKAAIIDPEGAGGVGSIAVAAITVMDSTNSPNHFDMALDGDDVHFIINGNSNVYHARYTAATLVAEVPIHQITGITSYWQDVKAVADANHNVHIVNRTNPNSGQPYYAMVDAAGVLQIGETLLADDGSGTAFTYGNHFAIAMQGDNVKVLYGSKANTFDGTCNRCWEGQGGTAYLVTLDPSAHSGAVGAAGDLGELQVGDQVRVGNTWYFQGFRGSDGDFHVMGGTGGRGAGDIAYYKVNGSSVSEHVVTANNEAYQYYRKYIVGAGNMVVWAEAFFVPTLSGVSTKLVAAKVSAFDGGGGGGGAPAPMLLVVLGLAGLIRARLRR